MRKPTAIAVGLILVLQALVGGTAHAVERITVLDFELLDLTASPGTTQEIERTASVAPLLRTEFENRAGYQVAAVASDDQARADAGVGYLYDRPALAAELAYNAGADWVVVGRVHKPSFLFAYLKAQLVDARTGALTADLVVEVKGPLQSGTKRGVASLARQIDLAIRNRVASQ